MNLIPIEPERVRDGRHRSVTRLHSSLSIGQADGDVGTVNNFVLTKKKWLTYLVTKVKKWLTFSGEYFFLLRVFCTGTEFINANFFAR